MVKIFYGNGECEVQGEDIIYCELIVKYPIQIDDKSPEGFIIKARNNKIIIAKFFQDSNAQLKEMFNYIGELKIVQAATINKNGDRESPTIKRVMDYTELLTTKAEDMTTLSENLKSTHIHGVRVSKMKLMQPYLENMTTSHEHYYLQDGSNYSGSYHIHHEDGRYMTGRTHTEDSLPLYFKDIYGDDIRDELILFSYHNLKNTRTYKTFGKRFRERGKKR